MRNTISSDGHNIQCPRITRHFVQTVYRPKSAKNVKISTKKLAHLAEIRFNTTNNQVKQITTKSNEKASKNNQSNQKQGEKKVANQTPSMTNRAH
jgi:hypothetical protein